MQDFSLAHSLSTSFFFFLATHLPFSHTMLASTGRRIASSSTTLAKRLSSEDLAGLASAAVKQCVGGPATAARALSSAADSLDIKAVLEQKIPVEQVCGGVRGRRRGKETERGAGHNFFFRRGRRVGLSCCVRSPPAHSLFTLSPHTQERLKAIKKEHGGKEVGAVTVDMVIGGMRGITVRGERVDASLDGRESNGRVCVTLPAPYAFPPHQTPTGPALGNVAAGRRGRHQVSRVQHPRVPGA